MAIPTVTISGRVEVPGAAPVRSGTLTVTLSDSASALDGAEAVVVATRVKATIGRGGTVSLAIPANDILTPDGTHYVAEFEVVLADGSRPAKFTQLWQVPSGGALDLGAVPRLGLAPGVAVTVESAVQAGVLAAATASAAAAALSQATAANSETSATASAADALASKIAAESARDASVLGAGLEVDEPTGRLTVADGQTFRVQGSGDVVAYVYRRVNASTPSTLIGMVASTQAVTTLQGALLPKKAATADDLDFVADADDNVYRYTDAEGGLHLAGMTGTVQQTAGKIEEGANSAGDLHAFTDADRNVFGIVDQDAGWHLTELPGSLQHGVNAALTGVPGYLLPGFKPFDRSKVVRGAGRYVWAGMRREDRFGATKIIGYPFSWNPVPGGFVTDTLIKRRVETQTAPGTWTTEALTINAPPGYFATYQFRDVSFIWDRVLEKYWYLVHAITSYGNGYQTNKIGVWSSTDGVVIDFVAWITLDDSVTAAPPLNHLTSPEFFIDDDGEVYFIVAVSDLYATGNFPGKQALHLYRCTDRETMATWVHHGRVGHGAGFPSDVDGDMNVIDPWMMKRGGVYYIGWKAEASYAPHWPTVPDQMTQGWAAAVNILGPYQHGQQFQRSSSESTLRILGEGSGILEMPIGHPRRWRLYVDDQGAQYSGQYVYFESDDLMNWAGPYDTGLGDLITDFNKHSTFVLGDDTMP